jgi:hypothetical protein
MNIGKKTAESNFVLYNVMNLQRDILSLVWCPRQKLTAFIHETDCEQQ